MAVIGNSFPSLIDYFKAVDPKGVILPTIETLTNLNPIMKDAYVEEANQGLFHISSMRTGLPEPTWGRLYQGIPQTKSTKQQVTDTSGFLESIAQVDVRHPAYRKNRVAHLTDEANAHMEGIAQRAQSAFFYANSATNPEQPKGIAARYDSLSNTQVIDAGGTGSDNTSIYGVTWGRGKTGMFYPEGTKAGITRENKGEEMVEDDIGNPYFAHVEYFKQELGIYTGDWRYNVRIANIDVSELRAGNIDLYALMRKAYYQLEGVYEAQKRDSSLKPLGGDTRTVFYVNREVMQALDTQGTDDDKLQLRPVDLEGGMIETYRRSPIRMTDALINSEERVV